MQKRKCSSSVLSSPFVELCCPQYKSLNGDCQPNHFTFSPSSSIFVEKRAICPAPIPKITALYTNTVSVFSHFSAVKMRIWQVFMTSVHIFSFAPEPRASALDIPANIPYNAPKLRQGGMEDALSSEKRTAPPARRVSFYDGIFFGRNDRFLCR